MLIALSCVFLVKYVLNLLAVFEFVLFWFVLNIDYY